MTLVYLAWRPSGNQGFLTPQVHPELEISVLEKGCLTSALLILGMDNSLRWGLACALWDIQHHPGFYSLNPSSTAPPHVTTKNISRYCQMSPRGQNCPNWITALKKVCMGENLIRLNWLNPWYTELENYHFKWNYNKEYLLSILIFPSSMRNVDSFPFLFTKVIGASFKP